MDQGILEKFLSMENKIKVKPTISNFHVCCLEICSQLIKDK